jgi:hypothetical protein
MMERLLRSIGRVCVCLVAGLFATNTGAAGSADSLSRSIHGPFVFRAAPTDQPLVNALEPLADRAWQRLTLDLGGAPAEPITVMLAPDDEAFNQFQPPGESLPDWATGVAYPHSMTMAIRSYHVAGSPRQDIGTIFVHELTHLVLGARFGTHPVPAWLHEGLAMYEAGEWRFEQEWELVWAVLGNGVPRVEDLTGSFPTSETEARIAYLFSEALVGHMIATYGRAAFGAFVGRLAEGKSFEDALIRTVGVSQSRFEARWRAHLDRRYAWIPLITSSSALWVVMMAVAFVAYAARRRRNRKIVAEWEEEERQGEQAPP